MDFRTLDFKTLDFKTFLEHFDTVARMTNAIAKLRSLILNLAVQGKLVSQKIRRSTCI
ncbi:MAG: hypothetical protein KME43_23680 [Myxacorys chilensis ATA2-1-KO14]|nr:hypothetical protein [Myxacorys chilensis ATA2-1-KO14]